jgi:hypothetical protein
MVTPRHTGVQIDHLHKKRGHTHQAPRAAAIEAKVRGDMDFSGKKRQIRERKGKSGKLGDSGESGNS